MSATKAASKLGRNPFQKPAPDKAAPKKVTQLSQPDSSEDDQKSELAQLGSTLAKIALVDVPAGAIVLGLKVFLLARETFSSKRN